ncbi:PhzF family phenazine biosynthesis protein [Halorubellus sp. JP-L1]|uniref:PhzF family phenazine biosynthesis protein n=1 Tax=Halorubellus sp. JP-L1 TaxID=2715753 RepID=UPI00140B4886|nr:PhzF family phenazine biosynthesis protein [Halorubellus sp. JP-L1]NHN41192.1 PhzF family phenazine biosynthesis protein [Halorubellus sp. JP-L1]
MGGRRFHTVDVFAREPYAGNQLAVFHDADASDPEAADFEVADLDDETMLALTRETNYSEATFVEDADPDDDRYPVRIFDPAEEIPFAGHPTIGTAAVLREFVRDDRPDELVLDLAVGDVRVWVETDADGTERYWMDQVEPEFGASIERDAVASVLGLASDDVRDAPIEVVSTGLPTLVVPLASLDAVERAATQPAAYEREIVDGLGGANVLVVAPETVDADADLHARVFADWAGVPEDPATGSAAGCLAAYLAHHDDAARRMGLHVPESGRERDDGGDAVDLAVEQGYEMNRPSRLHLRASVRDGGDGDSEGGIDVRVGGRVVPISEGHLLQPT